MAWLAATATAPPTHDGRLIAVLLITLAGVTVCYAFGCWLWPFATCTRCKGTGKRRSPFGSAFGACRRCDGTGRSLRIGRRILNGLRELHDKGSR